MVILEGNYSGEFGYLNISDGGRKSRIVPNYLPSEITLSYEDFTLSNIGGLTDNQKAAATLIDADPIGGELWSLAEAIVGTGSDGDIKAALGEVSGEFFTFVFPKALSSNLDAVYSRLNLNTVEETGFDHKEVWTQFSVKGNANKDDDILGGADFKSDGVDAQIGVDVLNNGDRAVGGFFAGFGSEKFTQGGNSGSLTEFLLGIYGGSFGDRWHFSAAFAGSFMNFATERNLAFAGLNPSASFGAYGIKVGGEAKMITQGQVLGGFLAPYLGVNVAFMSISEFSEEGGGAANLTINPGGLSDMNAILGLALEDGEGLIKWSFRVYTGLGFGGAREYDVSFSQAKDAGSMNIKGPDGSAFLIGMKAGCEYGFSEYFSVFVNGGYEQAGQGGGYRFGGGFNYKI